jgi:hypothetical protein
MSNSEQQDISMNPDELYLEESFTDQKIGSIRRLTPVTAEGQPDNSRTVLYIGQTQMMTPAGALPLTFEITATSLADAANQYADEAHKAMERTMEELKELRRQQASQIVVPGQPGSKIQMP